MINVSLFESPPSQSIQVMGMGMFDGIHRGHQHVLSGCDTMVTFEPHPQRLFNPDCDLQYLTPLTEKKRLFGHVVAFRFTHEFASLSPDEFLLMIQTQLSPQKIVVGYDFKFGLNAAGDIEKMKQWGKKEGVEIVCKAPFVENNKPVKSSDVRTAIKAGNILQANGLLGREYRLGGKVITGDGRGRQLGYPTANIMVPSDKLLPKEGVYYGRVSLSDQCYRVAVSIGTQPTFKTIEKQINMMIEAHIIGFQGDLYGQELIINLHRFIRDQQSFGSNDKLIQQIESDIEEINKR